MKTCRKGGRAGHAAGLFDELIIDNFASAVPLPGDGFGICPADYRPGMRLTPSGIAG